ncbi:3-oxoacyl-(acyl carrier protein) synthase III [Syntrophotalea carbinolica DSM 2380]|uniref:Beta-ketoacyl-[acyl-carrier-protein] synthase III n=1 Tax=Syntrophotalea carbinolica (strain DSM 2380 / NBRC 103641 / GraBd1) TaxID=338963 RepID=Q3A085_SYNC1|nr:beta-ketoacyl-ACP synthase III [Syntrophotalea carbinolica]ABA90222.1 3-oxoacyl-(acyl carrier protein) synthase III [Syntrophotalea carbinolica DSM 2380]
MDNSTRAMILGTGRSIPEKILTNADLEKMVDTNDAWIVERSGIRTRHIVEPGTPLSSLAAAAGKQAIEDAGLAVTDIDLIILATVTGDMKFPATACFVQTLLGAENAAAFDISAACSGFLYGMQLADSLIRTGTHRNILLIGGEVLTSMVNWEDRNTCVLFGDGAGAVVLGPSQQDRGILTTQIGADGNHSKLLYNPGCGSINPPTPENARDKLHTLRMEGREVFRHAVVCMSRSMKKSLKAAGVAIEDLDLVISHQANLRIIEALAKRLKLTEGQGYVNVDRYGNTSAASIPIALDEARRNGRIGEGDMVGLVTFGAGFTWGSSIVRL